MHIGHCRYMDERDVIAALKALAQHTRLRIMRLLVRSPGGLAAGAIAKALGVRQNTLSSHIGILVRAGLIDGRRQGRSIIYSIDARQARQLNARIAASLEETQSSAR